MTFGRSPHALSSGFGPVPTGSRLDAPYADGLADGFGGRGPAPDGFGGGPDRRDGADSGPASSASDLAITPATITLPPTAVGTTSTITATLANDGDAELAIDSLEVSNRAFQVNLLGSNSIAPESRRIIEISFAPTPPMLGAQHAVLAVNLQNGERFTAPVAASAEPPAVAAAPPASATPPSPTLDLGGRVRTSGSGQSRPDDPSARCDADNRGQFAVSAIHAARIHNPGTTGEFRDPVATTLYPQDLIEITVELAGAEADADFGRIEDSAGLLVMRSAERHGDALVLRAEATRPGRTFTQLSILSGGEELARLPYAGMSVVDDLADGDHVKDGSRRVKTTDITEALGQLRVAARSVFTAQKGGVLRAKEALLQEPARPTTPWYAELFALGAEAAISFVTAGIGNRLGRALAKWSVGARDFDLDKVPVFDLESAFGAGLKDSLKSLAREHLLSRGRTAGMTVDEKWAIDLFCEAQVLALEQVELDFEGELNNGAKVYKDLEALRAGTGLAAVEAHRHALAETEAPVRDESERTTIREWLKSLAKATHGTHAVAPASAAGLDAPDDSPPAWGSDMGHAGRGHLVVTVRRDDPDEPAAATAMAIAGVAGPAPAELRGTIREIGLPVEVHLGTMVVRRNEVGQVWIETRGNLAVLGGDLSRAEEAYLYAKGTGRIEWANDRDRWAGVEAGTDMLLAEVLALPVNIR